MSIYRYFKNIRAKFHPDPIWNDGDLSLKRSLQREEEVKNNNKMSSDMRSVTDPKTVW